jgi:hypothetical protein
MGWRLLRAGGALCLCVLGACAEPVEIEGDSPSKRPAAPMPPPMHIVTMAYRPPRRLSSWSASR